MNDIEKHQEKRNKGELNNMYKKIIIIFLSIVIGMNLIGLIVHLITR